MRADLALIDPVTFYIDRYRLTYCHPFSNLTALERDDAVHDTVLDVPVHEDREDAHLIPQEATCDA